ncbi:hypothetical protein, variant [Aphanomyces invadans]|uniref:Uncharacterized protein n=1 Tax=Aphanomyces invadans TaxID=157072 RepID=A0A024TIA5_9STRA|nr:hypothetical protein, variant [Aphanomyces invadans]ETV93875.1 hypothetical protein, variant [Aphanomyces invadans]|eukprot:XP_008877434.1 hypothetical protein, variant [Aphanomyces invadans]
MALYKSLESDVTSFFVAQGSLIESLVHSLCLRVTAIETDASKHVGAIGPDLSHVAAMIATSTQQCLAYVDEKIDAVNYKLLGLDAEFDRINRSLESIFQSLGQVKHRQQESQCQHEAAVDNLTRQCRDIHEHINAVQATVPNMAEWEIAWRDRVLCGLSPLELMGLSNDLTALSHLSDCRDLALDTRHAIQKILNARPGEAEPPLAAMIDLERGLVALVAHVQSTALNPEEAAGLAELACAMTELPAKSKRVQWGIWSSMHSTGLQARQMVADSMAALDLKHEVLRCQFEHVQTELERHAQLEHQLEMQLAMCPRQDDMLAQLNHLQAKVFVLVV